MRRMLMCLMMVSSVGFAAKKQLTPAKKAPPPPPPPITEISAQLKDAMGEKAAAMLTGATKITMFKVLSQPGVRPNPALAVGVDYEKQGNGRELNASEMKQLRNIVYDEKSFKYAAPPCNTFVPELAMLANNDDDTGTLEMLYSFKCGALMFFTAKTAGRSLPGAQIDFRPAKKPLLELMKGFMPQEPTVQALK